MLKWLAVIAVVLAVAQAFIPIFGQASNKSANYSKDIRKPADTGANPPSPALVAPAQDSGSQSLKPKSYGDPSEHQQTSINVSNLAPVTEWTWYEKIAWGSGVVLTGFLIWGVLVARATLRKIAEQTAATVRAADAAKCSVDIATRQMSINSRAWISAKVKEHQIESGKSVKVVIDFENFGQTPAVNVHTWHAVKAVKGRGLKPKTIYHANKRSRGSQVVMPKASIARFQALKASPRFELGLFDILLPAGYGLIRDRKYSIIAYGMVEYEDIFGAPHWTKFCLRFVPDGAWGLCETGNGIDKEGEQGQSPN